LAFVAPFVLELVLVGQLFHGNRGNVAADASSPATGKMNVPWPVDNPLLLDWTDQRLYGSKCGRPLNLPNDFECWLIEQPLDGNIKCIVIRPVGEKMRRSPFLYLEHIH
jgi:hypothetical protein